MDSPKAFGNTFFCEDIRTEIDGKLTIVGLFPTGGMMVQGVFPAQIPKFVMWVQLFITHGELDHDMVIEITLPEEENGSKINVPLKQLRANMAPPSPEMFKDAEGPLRDFFHFPFVFTPLVLKAPGLIKVRAILGDLTVKLGSFKVERNPTPAPTPAFSTI